MGTNYRAKPLVSSNVYPDVRICGMFAISATDGSLGTITRPSAGSGATAGKGELFTVTQPGGASVYQYLVTLTEQYFAPVWVEARVLLVPPANSGTTAPTAPSAPILASTYNVGTFVTMPDVAIETGGTGVGSNSFYISLVANNALVNSGALTLPGSYTAQIGFEVCFKNSVSPNTL